MLISTQPNGHMSESDTLDKVRAAADPLAPFPNQLSWFRRFRKCSSGAVHPIRIALMGSGTLNLLADTLRLWLGLEGYAAEIYLCAYGSFRQEILDPDSAFYTFQPDVVWLIATERDLDFRQVVAGADTDTCEAAVLSAAEEWRSCWRQLRSRRPLTIIQNNFEAPSLRVFGHYEAAVPWSRINLIQRLNLTISNYASRDRVTIFDLHYIAGNFGLSRWREDRHWHQSKQPFTPDAFGVVAFQFARLVGAMKGTSKKCVVLDLDNTLWGGVIGDDGIDGIQLGDGPEGEAFVAFQEYLKALLGRGILLAVCSKNDQVTAEEPFRKHPAMRLRLEDIACFRANWENKADNLREIARALNLGLDALVFVDDNPVERELVQSQLPEVSVVALPEDPSDYAAALAAGCFFETASFSSEDIARARFYQENSERESAKNSATDLGTFLRDLEMEASSGTADSFHLPRMAQLLAKTNQFHLTTTRPSEAELAALSVDPQVWLRWFALRDRIGDHGLISVVILRPEDDSLAIDTWAMSCRVFSRGMEEFILLQMVQAGRASGAQRLVGRFLPTAKNRPVADLYHRLGFSFDAMEEAGSRWVLDLASPNLHFAPLIRWAERKETLGMAVGT